MAARPEVLPQHAHIAAKNSAERWFFSGMAIVLLITIFAGFAPTYYLRGTFGDLQSIRAMPELTPSLLMHGFAFSAWMVLLLIQTSLVAANRTDIHRRLGVVGGVLGVLMMVLGAYVAISRVATGLTQSPPRGDSVAGPDTAACNVSRFSGALRLGAMVPKAQRHPQASRVNRYA